MSSRPYVFVPVVAHGMLTAIRDRRMGLAMPLGVAGLMLAHLPTTLLAAHVFAATVLVHALHDPCAAGQALPRLAVMGLAGAALAAPFWLPAIVLLADVSPQALYELEIMKPKPWLFFWDSTLPDTRWEKLNLYVCVAGLAAALLALR